MSINLSRFIPADQTVFCVYKGRIRYIKQVFIRLFEAVHLTHCFIIDKSDARFLLFIPDKVGIVGYMGSLDSQSNSHPRHSHNYQMHIFLWFVSDRLIIQRQIINLTDTTRISHKYFLRPCFVKVKRTEINIFLYIIINIRELEDGKSRLIFKEYVALQRRFPILFLAKFAYQIQTVDIHRVMIIFHIIQLSVISQYKDFFRIRHIQLFQFFFRVSHGMNQNDSLLLVLCEIGE